MEPQIYEEKLLSDFHITFFMTLIRGNSDRFFRLSFVILANVSAM